MSRSGKIKKITIASDRIYNSRLVAKIINVVMKAGKKSIAQKQVYQALDILKAKTKADPLDSLCQALDNVKPSMEVRSRRIGGAAYQVPSPVRGDRKESLSIPRTWEQRMVQYSAGVARKYVIVHVAKEVERTLTLLVD